MDRNGANIGGQHAQPCPLHTNHNCSQECKEPLRGTYCKNSTSKSPQDFNPLHHSVLSTDTFDMRDTLASSSNPVSSVSQATPRTGYADTLSALNQLELTDDSDSEFSYNYTTSKLGAGNNEKEQNSNSTYTQVYGTSTEPSNQLPRNSIRFPRIGNATLGDNQRPPTTSKNGDGHFQEQSDTHADCSQKLQTQNISLPRKENEPPSPAQAMSLAKGQHKNSENHLNEADDVSEVYDFRGKDVRGIGSWINNTRPPNPEFSGRDGRLGDERNLVLENVHLKNVRKCPGGGRQTSSIVSRPARGLGSNYPASGYSGAGHTNGNADEEQADGDGLPRGSWPDFRSTDNTRVKFACPFHKRYPQRFHQGTLDSGNNTYRICAGPGFGNVSKVKEHLFRRHKIPPHCIRCGQAFPSPALLNVHLLNIDQVGCTPHTFQQFCGLTTEMESSLRAQRHPRGQTEEGKWRDVYALLFQVERDSIPSPYYDASENTQSRHSQHYDDFITQCFIPLFESHLNFLAPDIRQNVLSALHSCLAQVSPTGLGGQGPSEIGTEPNSRVTSTFTSAASTSFYPHAYAANYGVLSSSIQNVAPNSQPLPVVPAGPQAWNTPLEDPFQLRPQTEFNQQNYNTQLGSQQRQGSDSGFASSSSCGNCGSCDNCIDFRSVPIAALDMPLSAPVTNGQQTTSDADFRDNSARRTSLNPSVWVYGPSDVQNHFYGAYGEGNQ